MNQKLKRTIHTLTVATWTAFWIFAGLVAPFAFAYIPTEAQVIGIYEFAAECAAAGFLGQIAWAFIRRPKL